MEDKGQILLYQTPDGVTRIEVKLQNETVWLSLDQMAELFQRKKSTISRHIKNVFEEGELQPDSTVAFFATVQTEGKRKVERDIAYYNLYIDYAELRAKDHKPMYMRDWIQKLDDFLRLSDREILTHAGSISAKLAKEKADAEYDKFKERTANELTPVEIHFIEQFEREQKKLGDMKKD